MLSWLSIKILGIASVETRAPQRTDKTYGSGNVQDLNKAIISGMEKKTLTRSSKPP